MKNNKKLNLFFFLLLILCVSGASVVMAQKDQKTGKIFWVDSYNKGYAWSDGIERGILDRINNETVELMTFHMDTKKCKTPTCMQEAAQKAKAAIDSFKPDVLIASDDNAQKFLVKPFYKDTKLPVVFCGVNWDASTYGYPTENITGMIEVDLVREAVAHMSRFAKGDRIGYISGDTTSDRKIIAWLNNHYFNQKMKEVRVKDFSEFKKQFIALQEEVDMFFIRNYAGIVGWNDLAAQKFIAKHLKIPSGSNNDFMAPYVIFTLGKISEEQGQYAADTALKIIDGMSPSDFPIVENKQARLTVNLNMAGAADIVLPLTVLKIARVIGQKTYDQQESNKELMQHDYSGKKIAWVDSYHKGYEWSDGVERAIRETLFESGAELKIFRMNTKRDNTVNLMKAAAKHIKEELDTFKPDVVIASDDNAQKYLIVPYYKDTLLPVVFCGVNWSADMYGYPAPNITGMVEINPIKETMEILKPLSQGDRVGFLAGDVATERKIANVYNSQVFNNKMKFYLVRTLAEFKKSFLKAQKEVDILYVSNYTGIVDWDAKTAKQFILKNTRIPTTSNNNFMQQYVACTFAKSSEEQGRYAAVTALKILRGESAAKLPIVTNKESKLTVNLRLAKKADIVFPISILKKAHIIGKEGIH